MTASPLIPRRERIVTWGNSVRVADSAVAPVGDDFTAAGVVHDLTGPRSPNLRSTYDDLEDRMATVVARRFGFAAQVNNPTIKEADMIALAIEADMTWGEGTAVSWGLPTPPNGGYLTWGVDTRLEQRLLATYTNIAAVPATVIEGTDTFNTQFRSHL